MKATILLIEDNPTTRRLVRSALEPKGYEVAEATTGELALEAIERRAPDLVLQDIILPDMDGFELIARLRARLTTPRVPILALTGFLSTLAEARLLAAGCGPVRGRAGAWPPGDPAARAAGRDELDHG